MKYIILLIIILVTGIIVGFCFDILIILSLLSLFLITVLIKILFNKKINIKLIFFCCIFFSISIYTYITNSIEMTPEYNFVNKSACINCIIKDIPIYSDSNVTFIAEIDNIVYQNEKIKGSSLVKVSIKGNKKYSYNDRLRINSVIREPLPKRNTGEFNYKLYLKTKRIYYTINCKENNVSIISHNNNISNIYDTAIYLKQKITASINRYLPRQEASLAKGIMIGEKSDFSREMKDYIRKSGLSHITAVSGMHTAIINMGILWLLNLFKLRISIRNITASAVIIMFILITGCTPSVLRSGIMILIYLYGEILLKRKDCLKSLFVSIIIILVYNPLVLFSASFQLSFSATLSILLFTSHFNKILSTNSRLITYLTEIISASLAAQIGTIPLIVYHFKSISIISIITNIFVLPVMSFLMPAGIVLCVTACISSFVAKLSAGFLFIILRYIIIVARLFSNFKISNVYIPVNNYLIYFLYILTIIGLYLSITKKYKRIIYIIICCILITSTIITFIDIVESNTLKVSFINVGQGDAALVQFKGKSILIDSGGSEYYDIGSNVIIPYILNRGINCIDIVIISHYHKDHVQGCITLLEQISIDTIIVPYRKGLNELAKELYNKSKQTNTNIITIKMGDTINIDDLHIDILYPNLKKSIKYDENNASLVFRLKYDNKSILFTGDIENAAMEYILNNNMDIESDILKMPHHGSLVENTYEFIKRVNPDYTIISVGKNKFGHPSKGLIQFLKTNDIIYFRTDINGDICFKIRSDKIKSKCLREKTYEY